jgi:hypothetical protein
VIGHRTRNAIGASLIALALVLAAPTSGSAQLTVRSGISADKPLSHHLSALQGNSWLTRHGMWVRHDGLWAFRPTHRFDWQACFRCQAGYGCGGIGWAPYAYSSWLPFGYAGWDQVPGGWMWFPGRRLSTSRSWDLYWDLWFFRPAYRFGSYASGSPGAAPFLFSEKSAWQDIVGAPDRWRTYRQGHESIGARPSEAPLVDPVRSLPALSSGTDNPDGREAGRSVPRAASIDRVRLAPALEPRAKDVSRPGAPRALERRPNSSNSRDRLGTARPSGTGVVKSPGRPARAATPNRPTPRTATPSRQANPSKKTARKQ